MTDITPGRDFDQDTDEDIRPADIAMALGGLWLLLAALAYLTISAVMTTPSPSDRLTLSLSDISQQAVDASHGTKAD